MNIQPVSGTSAPSPAIVPAVPADATASPAPVADPNDALVSSDQASQVIFRPQLAEKATLLWAQAIEKKDGPGSYVPVCLQDGTIVVNGRTGTFAFSPEGKPLWKLDLGDCAYRPPVVVGDTMFINSTQKETLFAVRCPKGQQPEIAWQKHLGKRGSSAAPVPGPDGNLYVADNDRRLWILSPDGKEVGHVDWENMMSEEPRFLPDGRVLLHGYDGWVGLVNPKAHANGLWGIFQGDGPHLERAIHGEILQPTGIGPDGSIYEIQDGSRIRHRSADGQSVLWECTLDRRETSVHLTLRPDGVTYALSGNSLLTAISPQGKTLWKWEPEGGVSWDYTLDSQQNAYFTGESANWKAFALDADGHQKWQVDLPSHADSPSLTPDGRLLLGGNMAPLRVLDPSDGRVLTTEEFELSFGNPPAIGTSDGRILATTEKGELKAFSLPTEQQRQQERIEEAQAIPQAPPPPRIQPGEGFVVIGGVKVPVRPHSS